MAIKTYNLESSYKYYVESSKTDNPVDLSTYLSIASGYFKFIMKKVLDGFFVELSAAKRMGMLGIRGIKTKIAFNEDGTIRLPVSWGKTKKLWESDPVAKANKTLVYCTNEHTNGYKYNFVWLTTDMTVANKILYAMTMSSIAKEELSKRIYEGKEYVIKTDVKY
jgi:hypothetical protein